MIVTACLSVFGCHFVVILIGLFNRTNFLEFQTFIKNLEENSCFWQFLTDFFFVKTTANFAILALHS